MGLSYQLNVAEEENVESKKLILLRDMMLSREAEKRENILFRQGRGQFHLPSAGHEALAGLAPLIKKNDWLYCYYRDRALLLAMGMPLRDIALGYFAKAESSSGGRQMSSHFSYQPLNVVSCATPTGLQCLPAVGTAWAFKKDKTDDVVFCSIGDASTRQGEFFEALAFAIQESLPIVFLVEDNGYGVSTPTEGMTPLALNMIPKDVLHVLEGYCPELLNQKIEPLVKHVRNGKGPIVAWIEMDRMMSHTSSDDQTKYRKASELEEMKARDPLKKYKKALIQDGLISEDYIHLLDKRIFNEVKEIYSLAENEPEPDICKVKEHTFSLKPSSSRLNHEHLGRDEKIDWSMSEAFNLTLNTLLTENKKALIFGEDIEDPKGGVFGLTKGLSTRHEGQVINSPLAEATIAGTASGLSLAGYLPIFELQFIDFIGPAFNQIVNQVATLRWRSVGHFKCPLVIYAPCGSYISGGGPWHSQTNESWLAHAPGLKVYMPSDANDAAEMLYSAAYGYDPVIMLLPKNQFQKRCRIEDATPLHPEKARIRKKGNDITLVSWGNCTELSMKASLELQQDNIHAEIIDLRSITPCDWATLHQSVRKTGRLVIVQEDNKTCSFGQGIISEMMSDNQTWEQMYAPPKLLSRADVHVGFNSKLERAVLPHVQDIVNQCKQCVGET